MYFGGYFGLLAGAGSGGGGVTPGPDPVPEPEEVAEYVVLESHVQAALDRLPEYLK